MQMAAQQADGAAELDGHPVMAAELLSSGSLESIACGILNGGCLLDCVLRCWLHDQREGTPAEETVQVCRSQGDKK